MLEALLPTADDETQAAIHQLIAGLLGRPGQLRACARTRRASIGASSSRSRERSRSKATSSSTLPIIGEKKIPINQTIPVNWSSQNNCGDCTLKTRTTKPVKLNGIPFAPPAAPLPYGAGTAKPDLKIDVDLKLIVDGYQCDPPKVEETQQLEQR